MYNFKAHGISVLNPVSIEKEYLDFTVDYAIKNKYNHFQFIGPIHENVKGNIDGMTFYKKYAQFNNEKNADYVNYNLDCVNVALEKLHNAGIKSYMWHHELELPVAFQDAFPEVLNSDGDIEVSHPLVKDFLEHKIKDFFDAYPLMDGIILTLHETRVPLLKLKNQKLGKVERVKHVTKILFDTCRELGKELICRPFASIEEDYVLMTKAYEEISTEMVIMDKWTQFDWSLTLPDNAFFKKIKKNPILVETDIFGEYFGKGRFPLMLKEHIEHKVEYCKTFAPLGFCNRIDRAGRHPFGDVNEVNLFIMNACMKGENVDDAIDGFYSNKYGVYGKDVRAIMENTEEILRRIIYLKGYYFSELSLFPQLNHSKNHFYFEMMREDYALCSGEWFIPKNWVRGDLEGVIAEKQSAVEMANESYDNLLKLKGKLDQAQFDKLNIKFLNLKICAEVWRALVDVFYNYAKFFENDDASKEVALYKSIEKLCELRDLGLEQLGGDYAILKDAGGAYWNYVYPIWWGQYEGINGYYNFFNGVIGETEDDFMVSAEVFRQRGKLHALQAMEDILLWDNGYFYKKSTGLDHEQAQQAFLLGDGVFYANGDWFAKEMEKQRNDAIQFGDKVYDIRMMKTPIISQIIEKTPSITNDEELRVVIRAIDKGFATLSAATDAVAEFSDADMALFERMENSSTGAKDYKKIVEARSIVHAIGPNHHAVVPSYALGKEIAYDFLLFMATDKAQEIYMNATGGASLPFEYDVETENPELWASFDNIEKDRLTYINKAKMGYETNVLPDPNSFPLVKYGGMSAVESMGGYSVIAYFSAEGQSKGAALTLFNDDIATYVDGGKFDTCRNKAGLGN